MYQIMYKLACQYRWLRSFIILWKNAKCSAHWRRLGLVILGGVLLTPLVYQLPLLGYDWYKQFYLGVLNMYPPWMIPLFQPFRWFHWRWSLAFLNSLTLVGVALITAWQTEDIRWSGFTAAFFALVNPPLWYLLWAGQIDGLVLIGFLALPWSMPIVLLRPQIVGWVMVARKKWLFGMALWLFMSVILWEWWIKHSFTLSAGSIAHPTAMGWATLGWPIFLIGILLFLISDGKFWQLLAAGFIASPYLQPYHMILLYPVLGRVNGWRRLVLWGWIWVVGVVPGFVGWTRYVALGFPLTAWLFLRDDNQIGIFP